MCLTIDKSKNTVILDIAYGFAYGLQEYRFQISNVWLHSLTVCRYWTERYRALYEGNSNCKQPGRYIAGRLSLHIIRNNIYIHTAQLLTFQPIFVPLKKKQNALLRFPCGLCVCASPPYHHLMAQQMLKKILGPTPILVTCFINTSHQWVWQCVRCWTLYFLWIFYACTESRKIWWYSEKAYKSLNAHISSPFAWHYSPSCTSISCYNHCHREYP